MHHFYVFNITSENSITTGEKFPHHEVREELSTEFDNPDSLDVFLDSFILSELEECPLIHIINLLLPLLHIHVIFPLNCAARVNLHI